MTLCDRINQSMSSIIFVESNIGWGSEFKSIANGIRSLLGNTALRIDHIGSTSVKDLAAKDVIDIQVTVYSIKDNCIDTKLIDGGYIYKKSITHDNLIGLDNDSPELEKKYFHEKIGNRKVHIHVREKDRINQIYPLVFRDYLRSDEQSKNAYEKVKKELANYFPNDSVSYYAIKDPFMDVVYKAAKLWAQQSNWQPDNQFV